MSVGRAIFRLMRRLPILRGLAEFAMLRGRNVIWYLRPVDKTHAGEIPTDFLELVETRLAGTHAPSVVEIGAGDGRVLRQLARNHPAGQFNGIDLQKAAVEFGNARAESEGLSGRVKIFQGSCLDSKNIPPCDYLISRTALVYLNSAEIRTFLRQVMPRVRRGFILQEVVSSTAQTEFSHFFAHPLASMIAESGGEEFVVTQQVLDYPPWKGPAWTGANVVALRVLGL